VKQSPDDKWNVMALVRLVFGRRLPLERETSLFVLVSALDVFMTYLILRYSAEQRLPLVFTEANAVARYFLHHWGIKGMVLFKFGMVAFSVTVIQIIAMKRLETARWLLNLATLLVCVVVLYSLSLLVRHMA